MLLLKGLRLLNNLYIPNSYRGRSYYLGFGEKGSLTCLDPNPIPVLYRTENDRYRIRLNNHSESTKMKRAVGGEAHASSTREREED